MGVLVKYFWIAFFLLVPGLAVYTFSQNNSIVLDGAYIVLDGGTAAANIYVVVDQSSTSGIVRPGGGHISSEGQYNFIKWVSGTSTGNYIFPFGVGGTAADYIPFTFDKTTGASSNIIMSTWTTNQQNVPHPAISNVAAVSNMVGVPDSVNNAIDRFWDIQSSAAVTADLTFSYRGSENTTLIPTDNFEAQHWNGTAWDPQAGPGSAGVTAGIGTVGPIPGQTTFSPWVLTRAGLNASVTAFQNVQCFGQCTGTATVTPTGGPTPYTYTWDGGQTTSSVTGLCAGTYSVIVTDNSGTTVTASVSITQPLAITASVTPTDVLCNAQCNGSALINLTGGTPGYTYQWSSSPVQSSANVSGLCAGIYFCVVTDLNGCTYTQSVTIGQPTVLTATATATSATCGNANGTATAGGSGGTGAYTYSWSSSFQTTQTATGLAAGNYTATVTDMNGCSATQTTTISNANGPAATLSQTNNICNGQCIGMATAAVTGGTQPYTYGWSNGQSSSAATNLCAGNYTVTVTDNNGCTTTQVSLITEPAAISVSVTGTPSSCSSATGTAAAIASGGSPAYSYLWSSGQTTSAASSLSAGSHTCTVSDTNGCSQTQTVTISTLPGPAVTVNATDTMITLGDSTQISATGGGAYLWSPSEGLSCISCSNPSATPSVTTTYCALVTDTNGCTDSSCITINVEIPCGAIYLPNAFSPNNDNENDQECVMGNCIEFMHLVIYDRWGEKVFEAHQQANCWDGTYKDEKENTGVFTYYLDVTLTNGEKIFKKGNISLIR